MQMLGWTLFMVVGLKAGATSEPDDASRNLRGGAAAGLANSSSSLPKVLLNHSTVQARSASSAEGAGDGVGPRCGADWANANSNCGKACRVDGDCDNGQRCFADLAACAGSSESSDANAGGHEDWLLELLQLVNSVRAQHGAQRLCLNDKLNAASQSQSDSGKYGHTWNYVKQQGYHYSWLGQNIARGQRSVREVFNAWYNEVPPNDGHRRNILNPRFTQMGAGWTRSTNMWTQNFGASDSESCSS
mmetsp:Transcript_37073/g.85682  ORF Transcript_37073/g.85682 Transcript_37073/m.85682 type:complete len:246 (-) Transcript_37073:413-1150(-)